MEIDFENDTLNEALKKAGFATAPVILRNGEVRDGRKNITQEGTGVVAYNIHASEAWAWLRTWDLMTKQDWYYQYSDDKRVYDKGRRGAAAIQRAAKLIKDQDAWEFLWKEFTGKDPAFFGEAAKL